MTNILLITSDQHHYSCLGSVNPRISTPALDRLATEGTRFDRAYTPNPVCTPARSSIITGLYPSVHGAWTIGVKLPEDVPTVGQQLSAAGYATSLVGKAHFQPLASTPESPSLEAQPLMRDLDFWRGFHGPWYGFDHVEVCRNHADESHAGQHYGVWLEEQGLSNWKEHFQPWPPDPDRTRRRHAWDLPEGLHYNVWIAERASALIEQAHAREQPFFLWASFPDPHPPYLVPAALGLHVPPGGDAAGDAHPRRARGQPAPLRADPGGAPGLLPLGRDLRQPRLPVPPASGGLAAPSNSASVRLLDSSRIADRVEMRAARKEHDLVSGLGEPSAEIAADRARRHHRNAHRSSAPRRDHLVAGAGQRNRYMVTPRMNSSVASPVPTSMTRGMGLSKMSTNHIRLENAPSRHNATPVARAQGFA